MSVSVEFTKFVPNKGYIISLPQNTQKRFIIESITLPSIWCSPQEILLEFKEYIAEFDKISLTYSKLVKKDETVYVPSYNAINYLYIHSHTNPEIYMEIKDLQGRGRNHIMVEGTLLLSSN